jgi:flagellar hook-length control protein FliK
MQADFSCFQAPFVGPAGAGPSAGAESTATKFRSGTNRSHDAGNSGFLGIMARLLGKPLHGGSFESDAETSASVSDDSADGDLSDQDAQLVQAAMQIGLDPQYLKNLVAAAEASTGPQQWQSLQTLLETLSVKLQQSAEPMPNSQIQALSTILNRVAELVSSKLASTDALSGTTAAVDPTAAAEGSGGFMQQLSELLAAIRSASRSSREFEQAEAVKAQTAKPGTAGPQNPVQSSDTQDSKAAAEQTAAVKVQTSGSNTTVAQDSVQTADTSGSRPGVNPSGVQDPGSSFSQQQTILARAKSWMETQAQSLAGSAAANTDSNSKAEGHAALTGTAGKPADDSAAHGSKHPLSAFTATRDQSLSAGSGAEQKATPVAEPASDQARSGIEDSRLADEETKIKIAGLKESEGVGWSQSSGDRSAEAALTARVDPQAREAFQSDALQQIIQKASVNLKNGENEIKIELKPEFLGHIRMQIVTEDHQVTLRVLTESPMVKDLIEHNIQHLRAELQQHGLKMDVVNVSLTNDSQTSTGGQWRTPRGKAGFRVGRVPSGEPESAATDRTAAPIVTRRSGNSAIDYFI